MDALGSSVDASVQGIRGDVILAGDTERVILVGALVKIELTDEEEERLWQSRPATTHSSTEKKWN